MISEFWTFGLQNLFVRTREPFFLTLIRTFGLKNFQTYGLGPVTLATWKEHFEASKPVCMVAMHYQLPFMVSKCLLQSP